MAYTSAPTFSSQQLKRIPIEGSQEPRAALTLGSNYINCHPRKYKQWGTDPRHVVEKRPSLEASTIAGFDSTKTPRGLWIDPSTDSLYTYFVQDGTAYNGSVSLGSLHYTTGYVGITKYLIDTTAYIVFLENHNTAAYIHYYNLNTSSWTSVALGTSAAGNPIFLDGYLFYSTSVGEPLTTPQRIYNSTIGAPTTWSSGTDYIDAEMFPDKVIGIDKHKNHIVAFGESSIEFFYDNANQYNSPLSRNQNYTIQLGTLPIGSSTPNIQKQPSAWTSIGDIIFFVGVASNGSVGIYKLENFEAINVSSAFLQRYLNATEVVTGDALATGNNAIRIHSVNVRGMPAIMLTVRRTSSYKIFVYIIEENVWVEWQWSVNGHNFYPLFVSDAVNSTFMIGDEYYSSTSHYRTYSLFNYEELSDPEIVTATVITDLHDFGTDNRKHFRYTDIIGDFGGHTITYSYTKNSDYSSFVSCGTVDYSTWSRDTPVRFRILGGGPRLASKIVMTGTGNVFLQGIEMAYNQGHQ